MAKKKAATTTAETTAVEPKPAKIERYEVTVALPKGVSMTAMKDHIEDAIVTMAKARDPDSPMFDLTSEDVKVKRIKPQPVVDNKQQQQQQEPQSGTTPATTDEVIIPAG